MGKTISDRVLAPFGWQRNTKLWIIAIFFGLNIIALVGPDVGLNIIQLDTKAFGFLQWKYILAIGSFFGLVWAKFGV